MSNPSRFKQFIVRHIYADHNSSGPVKKAISILIKELDEDTSKRGLNIGSGKSRLHERISNLDIVDGPFVDYIADGHTLPFDDNTFDIVIAQESLEHFEEPTTAVKEIYRVIKPNGLFYIQVPFIIGYHPGPTDYWRFTKEGIDKLVVQAGFACESVAISVGPATGFYRVLVEFLAIFASLFSEKSYLYVKGFMSLVLFPIKFLDLLLNRSSQKDRIAGGYFAIARKSV